MPYAALAEPIFLYLRRLDPCDVEFIEELSLDATLWTTDQTSFISLTPDTNAMMGTARSRPLPPPATAAPRLFRLHLSL